MQKNIKTLIVISIMFLSKAAFSVVIDYDQYQVKKIFKGELLKPNFVIHNETRKYRTVIENQIEKGPNFAGHYTIISIDCGTSCAKIAVVDLKAGNIYFPQKLQCLLDELVA